MLAFVQRAKSEVLKVLRARKTPVRCFETETLSLKKQNEHILKSFCFLSLRYSAAFRVIISIQRFEIVRTSGSLCISLMLSHSRYITNCIFNKITFRECFSLVQQTKRFMDSKLAQNSYSIKRKPDKVARSCNHTPSSAMHTFSTPGLSTAESQLSWKKFTSIDDLSYNISETKNNTEEIELKIFCSGERAKTQRTRNCVTTV